MCFENAFVTARASERAVSLRTQAIFNRRDAPANQAVAVELEEPDVDRRIWTCTDRPIYCL